MGPDLGGLASDRARAAHTRRLEAQEFVLRLRAGVTPSARDLEQAREAADLAVARSEFAHEVATQVQALAAETQGAAAVHLVDIAPTRRLDLRGGGPRPARRRLTADAWTAGRARRYVTSLCKDLPTDTVEVVRLLTTELVTNALWHTAGEAWLDVKVEEHLVTVGVTDKGGGEVRIANDYRWPESGHGLRLVDGLSDRWGSEPTHNPTGKRVWFELGIDQESSPREKG
jgi:anti-sigma regulatory factor (Ser/Thr protein kinase)